MGLELRALRAPSVVPNIFHPVGPRAGRLTGRGVARRGRAWRGVAWRGRVRRGAHAGGNHEDRRNAADHPEAGLAAVQYAYLLAGPVNSRQQYPHVT